MPELPARADAWTTRPGQQSRTRQQPAPTAPSASRQRTDDIVLLIERRDNRINLDWNDVAGAAGYQIIGRQEGSTWTNITNRLISENTFSIPIGRNGVTLQFIVAAIKDGKVYKRSKAVTIRL
ncbi:hypothetical protein JXO52_01670 [bacterium]|nr:hypothetical protein [bacterium]